MTSLQQNERRADIIASGKAQNAKRCCTPESRLVSKSRLSKPNENSSRSLTEDSFRILDLDSISKDVALSPFWNKQCQELQSALWLPHQIESRDRVSESCKRSSNYTAEKSSFWKKTYTPKDSTCKPSLVFSLPSATPKVESGLQDATRKIRVFPSEPRKVDRQLDYSRRAYNLCVATFRPWKKGDSPIDFTLLRRRVREIVSKEALENGDSIVTTLLDEACQEAKIANQAVIRKRVKSKKAELSFRKKLATKQGFIYQRLTKIALPKVLGTLHLTEEIPSEAFGKMSRIVREYGRYFLLTKVLIPTAAAESQGNAVGIDPGVRTFMTTFAQDRVSKLGENFQRDKLKPLGVKLDRLYSQRKKLFNSWSKLGEQYRQDMLRCYVKRINKLKSRRNDLIEDLHKRVAYYLVKTYDFLFLPTFEVKQMTNKQKRRIGTKVVRSMMDLCHYKFQLVLSWMCKKYGKTLLMVNESYTSQTQSWNGQRRNVGSAKEIVEGSLVVDRDINGARGIFLRVVTR